MLFAHTKNNMFAKTTLSFITLGLVLGGSFLQSSVLKVEAAVNVLLVSNTAIPFGTVFPGEVLSENYTVQLDTSSNGATYVTSTSTIAGLEDLCPFLDLKSVDVPAESDTLPTSTLNRPGDLLDKWQVGLSVPGIQGHLSQDHDGGIVIEGGDFGCKITIITDDEVALEYCSPGYWKQPLHFDSYPLPYTATTTFSGVFGVNVFPNKTLVDVLSTGGGGLNVYGRATVAALLNAAALNSGLTPAQVIQKFNATYGAAPGGNNNGYYGSANSEFTAPENCPLN